MVGIDIFYDFTIDSPGFWDGFWERNNGLGAGGCDPDSASRTLQLYHQVLWSKKLPNQNFMYLTMGEGLDYLSWMNHGKQFRFSSDSITASFRYRRYRDMLSKIERAVPDYRKFVEDYLRKAYTIGGEIIFPRRMGGINQSRGCSPFIRDRWDLTLECIRRYYAGVESPLASVLEEDRDFFDLFVDFKGYVDFFYLQDCVTADYKEVKLWMSGELFQQDPLPQSIEEYFTWIDRELDFVARRNQRIQEAYQHRMQLKKEFLSLKSVNEYYENKKHFEELDCDSECFDYWVKLCKTTEVPIPGISLPEFGWFFDDFEIVKAVNRKES